MRRREFLSWGLYGIGIGMTAGVVKRVAAKAHAARAPYRRLRTHVAGAPYRIGLSTQVDEVFEPGQRLRAVRQRQNAYDRPAVALYLGDWHVGYLPKDVDPGPEAALAAGADVAAEVVGVDVDDPWEGVAVELHWLESPTRTVRGDTFERSG